MVRRIVIIGGGCWGATAAQFARKTDRTAEITIIEREAYPQYSRCGLPYGISGIIPELTNLIEAPEERLKKNRIGILLGSTVTDIDSERRIAHIQTGDKKIEMPYELIKYD